MNVGRKIREIRNNKGLNQEEFGRNVLDAHKSLVSKWEKGVNLPNNERLKKIAEIGNTTVTQLLSNGCTFCEEQTDVRANGFLIQNKGDRLLLFCKGQTLKVQVSYCPFCGTEMKKPPIEMSGKENLSL